jgi:hypothetical protein
VNDKFKFLEIAGFSVSKVGEVEIPFFCETGINLLKKGKSFLLPEVETVVEWIIGL